MTTYSCTTPVFTNVPGFAALKGNTNLAIYNIKGNMHKTRETYTEY
jgi:hypothetical protein